MLNWKKIGVYAVAAVVGAGIWVFAYDRDHDVPAPPAKPALVETNVPAPKRVPKPRVVAKPAVIKPVIKPSIGVAHPKAFRPTTAKPGCAKVPPEAYRHNVDMVMSAMDAMGRTEAEKALVKRCVAR